jgi:hypothetical protein
VVRVPRDLPRLVVELRARGRGDVRDLAPRRCAAGRHDVAAGWAPSRGCPDCAAQDALDDAASVVAGLLPGLPAAQAATAVAAVTAGGLERLRPPRHRAIAAWLRTHPDALTSGASTAPLDVARLIDQLRAAGRDDVVAPRCADCGRARLLRATTEADMSAAVAAAASSSSG